MDVKTAIEAGDARGLRRLLADVPSRADELIRWGKGCRITTHPLHYISDMLFEGTLQKGREVPLVEVLIQAGANLDSSGTARVTRHLSERRAWERKKLGSGC